MPPLGPISPNIVQALDGRLLLSASTNQLAPVTAQSAPTAAFVHPATFITMSSARQWHEAILRRAAHKICCSLFSLIPLSIKKFWRPGAGVRGRGYWSSAMWESRPLRGPLTLKYRQGDMSILNPYWHVVCKR